MRKTLGERRCEKDVVIHSEKRRYKKDVFRITFLEKPYEKDVVNNTLRKRRYEKDVARKTLGERRCEKDCICCWLCISDVYVFFQR